MKAEEWIRIHCTAAKGNGLNEKADPVKVGFILA